MNGALILMAMGWGVLFYAILRGYPRSYWKWKAEEARRRKEGRT